jgi:SOS-response transcriptional repressor LexA
VASFAREVSIMEEQVFKQQVFEQQVFIQPVGVEVELDRRLRRGDALIVESRAAARDGELIVAESAFGACVGRWTAAAADVLLYPLESPSGPARVQRADLQVRGVVIGVRSAL